MKDIKRMILGTNLILIGLALLYNDMSEVAHGFFVVGMITSIKGYLMSENSVEKPDGEEEIPTEEQSDSN